MFVDSHCHLEFDALREDFEGVLSRALDAGVKTLLTIGTRFDGWDTLLNLAEKHTQNPAIYATIGIHPHETATLPSRPLKDVLCEQAAHPRVVGLGETGLDFYYNHADRETQIQSFHAHCEAALISQLPIVVHTRSAEDETLEILETYAPRGLRGVLHCFSGSHTLAQRALDLGFYISASGIITFKNAEDLRTVFKNVPPERLLIETDAPYLAPIPYRGKTNEPSFVVHTAEKLTALHGVTLDKMARITTENFHTLFNKVPMEAIP